MHLQTDATKTPAGLVFSDAEYARRLSAVRDEIRTAGLDALLISIPQNYYYLTGYQSGISHSLMFLVLPCEGEAFWVARRTELSNVRVFAEEMWAKTAYGVDDADDFVDVLVRALEEAGMASATLGIEQDSPTFSIGQYARLQSALPKARLRDATGTVEKVRVVKTKAELTYLREAGEITARALLDCFEAMAEGVTDTELGAVLTASAIRNGSDRMSCQPFLAFGARTALAHAGWIGEPLRLGEIVNAEVACAVARYHVPTFRVFSLGKPDAELQRMHDVSQKAMEAGLAGIEPGMTADAADRLVRAVIDGAGYGDAFVVRAAYGIGTAFPPSWGESTVINIKRGEMRVLVPGMTFHLVPALYADGLGCVCCSMPIEITETGVAPLTSIEPKLMVK
ncbi:MAG: Xaa-Pro peptidase family protein [Rhodovibrionaceae bacterium]